MSTLHPLPLGFRAAAQACGIKSDPDTLDLALFVSDTESASAGVFTQNRVVGAPVKVSRERIGRTSSRAVIINSGNSNACTGERGVDDARWMTAQLAERLSCAAADVLVCSTGIIGHFLPREKLAAGIPVGYGKLAATPEAFLSAARGMMTTDTFPKQASRTLMLGDRAVTISGACKGAAMIAPHMATMLAVVMTDARLSPQEAQLLLKEAVDDSFNCISIDEHTSTSDTVLLLANGAAHVDVNAGEAGTAFQSALRAVCTDLACQIIRDGEGAQHFVTLDVTGLPSRDDAWRIAKAVAESPLVKTAIAGNDPNWGRIVSAAGYAGVPFAETDVSLSINGIEVFQRGAPTVHDARAVSRGMATGEVQVVLAFSLGNAAVRFWTCDLTAEYVRLNSEYTT